MKVQAANVHLIQKMNRSKVLSFIRKNPWTTRSDIAYEPGLSLASITNLTSYLISNGLLKEVGMEDANRVGRKRTLLKFNSEGFRLICVMVYDETANIFITDLEGNVFSNECVSITDITQTRSINALLDALKNALEKSGKEITLGIGVFISGMILSKKNLALSSSHKIKNLDVKTLVENATGIPAFVENLSVIRAQSYVYNEDVSRVDNIIFVDMDNGIGAVQCSNGKVNRSILGEIGHTTVNPDGEECFCGNKGCLEVMCSAKRIISLYNSCSDSKCNNIEEISHKLSEDDPNANKALAECARYLGIGFANLVNLFYPSALVINRAGFSRCRAIFDEAVCEMKMRAYPALLQDLTITELDVSEEDTVRGAAFEMCERIFDISYENSII